MASINLAKKSITNVPTGVKERGLSPTRCKASEWNSHVKETCTQSVNKIRVGMSKGIMHRVCEGVNELLDLVQRFKTQAFSSLKELEFSPAELGMYLDAEAIKLTALNKEEAMEAGVAKNKPLTPANNTAVSGGAVDNKSASGITVVQPIIQAPVNNAPANPPASANDAMMQILLSLQSGQKSMADRLTALEKEDVDEMVNNMDDVKLDGDDNGDDDEVEATDTVKATKSTTAKPVEVPITASASATAPAKGGNKGGGKGGKPKNQKK